MNYEQDSVTTFHEAFGATVGTYPELRDRELRAKLILEEAVETVAAMGFHVQAEIADPGRFSYDDPNADVLASFDKSFDKPDFIETIDGLCDLLYVIYGAAVTFGIDLDEFFEEVHRSNMAKVGGTTRADGKVLKPEGWTPPDLERILIRQTNRAEMWKDLEQQALDLDSVEVLA